MGTEQEVGMNDNNACAPNIGKWLFGIMLLLPIILVMLGRLGLSINNQLTEYTISFGSPVLGAILIGIAIRHYPATRTFLKVLVAMILVVTLLAGGFWRCATLARSGKLLKTIIGFYSRYFHAEPPISTPNLVLLTLYYVDYPQSERLAEILYGLPVVGAYNSFFTAMPAPYYLLLLLITPPFLAMPIFWLWVVLSVLYVVLPRRAWGWMKALVVRFRHRA